MIIMISKIMHDPYTNKCLFSERNIISAELHTRTPTYVATYSYKYTYLHTHMSSQTRSKKFTNKYFCRYDSKGIVFL